MKINKRVILQNQYGEEVCEMVPDEVGYYSLPEGISTDCFAVGDVYSVVEVENEEE